MCLGVLGQEISPEKLSPLKYLTDTALFSSMQGIWRCYNGDWSCLEMLFQ